MEEPQKSVTVNLFSEDALKDMPPEVVARLAMSLYDGLLRVLTKLIDDPGITDGIRGALVTIGDDLMVQGMVIETVIRHMKKPERPGAN